MVQPNLHNYTIIFSKTAEKFLYSLDKPTKQRIVEKIRKLQTDIETLDIKKLRTHSLLYRLRVGSFRIIYSIEHERIIIYIIAIGLRKDVYQQIN